MEKVSYALQRFVASLNRTTDVHALRPARGGLPYEHAPPVHKDYLLAQGFSQEEVEKLLLKLSDQAINIEKLKRTDQWVSNDDLPTFDLKSPSRTSRKNSDGSTTVVASGYTRPINHDAKPGFTVLIGFGHVTIDQVGTFALYERRIVGSDDLPTWDVYATFEEDFLIVSRSTFNR